MQKLFTIDRIGKHGKLTIVRTDKGELLYEHAGSVFTECGFAMETVNHSEGEQNFIKGIIKFKKRFHENIPPKLKKCPFCGQIPILEPNGNRFIVECDCGCVIGSFDLKWDAVTAWNSRTNKGGEHCAVVQAPNRCTGADRAVQPCRVLP